MSKVSVKLGKTVYPVSSQVAKALGLTGGQSINGATWARIVDAETSYAVSLLRAVQPTERNRNGSRSRNTQHSATRTYRLGG